MKYDRKYVSDEAVEKFDDARFALLMEAYSARLGEDYVEENARLQEDESFILPSGLDEKCMKAIDSAIARKKCRANMEKAKRVTKRLTVLAASFLLVIAVSSVVLYNTVEAFRVVISDYVIELFDVGDGSLVSVEPNNDKSHALVTPSWIPDGYELTLDKREVDMTMLRYSNGNNTILFTAHSDVSMGSIIVDTEDSIESYDTNIAGHKGIMVIKDKEVLLYWFDSNVVYFIGTSVDESDTIIHIAESCYE